MQQITDKFNKLTTYLQSVAMEEFKSLPQFGHLFTHTDPDTSESVKVQSCNTVGIILNPQSSHIDPAWCLSGKSPVQSKE